MKKGCLQNTTIKFPSNFKHTGTWKQKTWNGLTSFKGKDVWSDGKNIYYSYGDNHYVLKGDTWEQKTFNGIGNFSGLTVWTDGTSCCCGDLVLNGDTWEQKIWNKPDDVEVNGANIWSDGTHVYLSNSTNHYRLNGDTWEKLEWDVKFNAITRGFLASVWSDGANIYYSKSSTHYVLNGNVWETTTWNKSLYGDMVWTDGTNIYYSHAALGYNYILNSGVWENVTWSNLTKPTGYQIWSDGTNIYYSNGAEQYVLEGEIIEPEPEQPTLTARDLYRKINGKPTKLTLYKKLGGKLIPLDEHTKEVKT